MKFVNFQPDIEPGNQTSQGTEPIVTVRRSAYLLFLKLATLELLLLSVFVILRAPIHLFDTSRIDPTYFFIFYSILVLILGLFKLFISFWVILLWVNEHYEILPQTLIHKRGIFRIQRSTFSLENIEFQEVRQSAIGRIFNFGTVEIYNPLLKQRFSLYNIPFPSKYLALIRRHSGRTDQNTKIMPLGGA